MKHVLLFENAFPDSGKLTVEEFLHLIDLNLIGLPAGLDLGGGRTLRVDANGSKEWYLDGKRHREDGPAIEYVNGSKYWYLDGKLHREDGPAIERADGSKYWYLDGKRHREDGPAIEYADGSKEWYLNGELR